MANIVFNALNLRPGGGLQVARALLEAMSIHETHHFTVWCGDPRSIAILETVFVGHPRISLEDPVGRSGNVRIFVWQMTQLSGALRRAGADLVIGINHHFPSGKIPQIVYHLNVLRFQRPAIALWKSGELANRLRDWRARCALRKATANVMESRYLLDLAAQKFQQIMDASVIYIGQRSGELEQQTLHRQVGRQTILALTSAQPHKDNPTLIRMLSRLVDRRSDVDWQLEIAGGQGASSFVDLQADAQALGISERVHFLGFQDHAALAERAQTALCLVSTSRVESFCMVALEAMSWSCPPIVADATSMPESVGDAGLLAPWGDADGFADQVLRLYRMPELRTTLIANGASRLDGMTWAAAGASFLELSDHVLSSQDPTKQEVKL